MKLCWQGVPFSVQFSGRWVTPQRQRLQTPVGGGDDSLLKQRRLQDGVTMRSEIFSVDDESEDENGEPLPAAVLIDTMGETTGFEVRFVGDDTQYIVFINEQGQLSLKGKPIMIRSNHSGFTLIEVMIALLIVSGGRGFGN